MVSNKAASDIVGKLWNLCNVLKDDGVTYHEYVTELTYLLFLKMANETGSESIIPTGYRWENILEEHASLRLKKYRLILATLSSSGTKLVKEIFSGADSVIKKPDTLSTLVNGIDRLDWYSIHREDLGDLYEGLLEKNANEKKSGAGQYFTPRALIDSMVSVMKPSLNDVIQDPAAGTGGFLIAANHFLREQYDIDGLTSTQKKKFSSNTFHGMEHVKDTHRLALMNLMLHGIDGGIRYGDTLSHDGTTLPKASLMLTNPPFGTKKGGGLPNRPDLSFATSNKQFAFLQHIYRGLAPGGRAAVVLPDNVLFDSNSGTLIRRELMDQCNVHTILRLPTGIFYAHGVKTNVLFFTRGKTDTGNTKEVWVYDLRTGTQPFGKRSQLARDFFVDFEICFGNDPWGGTEALASRRQHDRFRRYSRQQILARNDNLDLSWVCEVEPGSESSSLEPIELVRGAMGKLNGALCDFEKLLKALENKDDHER